MHTFNQSRRDNLKRLAKNGFVAGTVIAAPKSLANFDSHSAGISIKVYDNPIGHTVLVQNASHATRTLEAIQPFKIYTQSSSVNLKKLFLAGNIEIPPHTTEAFYISVTGEVSRHARWQARADQQDRSFPAAKIQPIDVIASVPGSPNYTRVRQHLARFA